MGKADLLAKKGREVPVRTIVEPLKKNTKNRKEKK